MVKVWPDELSQWLDAEPRPLDDVPGFRVEEPDVPGFRMPPEPPEADVPGFRMTPQGPANNSLADNVFSPMGLGPSANEAPSFGRGFGGALPTGAPPATYVPELRPFFPPFRDPLQDAFDQLQEIYVPAGGMLPSRADAQSPRPDFVASNSDSFLLNGSSPVSSPSPQSFSPPESTRYAGASQPPATIGPFHSVSWPGPDDNQQPTSESSRGANGQTERSAQPGIEASPPAAIANPTQPSLGSDAVDDTNPEPLDNAQIAQAKPAPQRRNPSAGPASPKAETGELPLQVRANKLLDHRRLRSAIFDDTVRAPLPDKFPPGSQLPLPDDWEGAIAKDNPSYLKLTNIAAAKYGIPVELLARLLFKESRYDRKAVSGMGARGIAQLMPRAVEDLGFDPNTFDYFDAEKSINAGAALLAKYHSQFKDWPKAVAAYNMGIGNLSSWLNASKGDDRLNDQTATMLQHVFRGNPNAYDKLPERRGNR